MISWRLLQTYVSGKSRKKTLKCAYSIPFRVAVCRRGGLLQKLGRGPRFLGHLRSKDKSLRRCDPFENEEDCIAFHNLIPFFILFFFFPVVDCKYK